MIISMKLHATRAEIDPVCERIRDFGYKVHSIEGEERVVIGVVGVGDVTACLESLEAMPQVEKAVRISAPYKFVSREFRTNKSVIRANGRDNGGDEFVVMAGPARWETRNRSSKPHKPWHAPAQHFCAAALSSQGPRLTIFRVLKNRA